MDSRAVNLTDVVRHLKEMMGANITDLKYVRHLNGLRVRLENGMKLTAKMRATYDLVAARVKTEQEAQEVKALFGHLWNAATGNNENEEYYALARKYGVEHTARRLVELVRDRVTILPPDSQDIDLELREAKGRA